MAINDLLSLIQKDFKKKYKDEAPEIRLGDNVPPATGLIVDNPLLEFILDQRFLAYGRCYLTYGKKGCSKTSLFFYLAKLFQQNGGDVIWIETEKAADLNYARLQGVDTGRLIMPEIESLQQALSFVETTIKNLPKAYPDGNTPILICLDSIAGSITDYELGDGCGVGETRVGEHARIMSSFYRRICGPLANEKCVFLALNQLKDVIVGGPAFGEKGEALIGGDAQRFHSTYQWKMARTSDMVMAQENGAERKIGSKHKITCKRNKLGREGNSQEVEYDLYIKGGIDWYSPLVRKLGKEYKKPLTKRGGWYTWDIPGTMYTAKVADANGQIQSVQMEIDVEKQYRETELGLIINQSPQAREIIRKEFEIPDLPPKEAIAELEQENKKKRGRKRVEEVDETAPKDTL
jgi:recombination protein RecA